MWATSTASVNVGERDEYGQLLVSVPHAARRLSLSERSTWNLIRAGKLRSVQVGGRRLIRLRDLQSFVEALDDGTQ